MGHMSCLDLYKQDERVGWTLSCGTEAKWVSEMQFGEFCPGGDFLSVVPLPLTLLQTAYEACPLHYRSKGKVWSHGHTMCRLFGFGIRSDKMGMELRAYEKMDDFSNVQLEPLEATLNKL